MNYIGSKHKLSSWLQESITTVCGEDLTSFIFCDLFAGTGAVGRSFKPLVKKIIANDLEYYSYILNRHYIGNHKEINVKELLDILNELKGKNGFITQEYSENGTSGRLYFTNSNGRKIDAIRTTIEQWLTEKKINKNQYYLLLTSLLEAGDKVANTASVYGAFLKKIKKTAQRDLCLEYPDYTLTQDSHAVYQEDGNNLIQHIQGDILYLDPPYNARQYGANYHLLNTIAKYNTFAPQGITGLPQYNKSAYCKKSQVCDAFEKLIASARFKYIFLSYNNEGLMTQKQVQKIMSAYGRYDVFTKNYQRFKADKTENRNHKALKTVEYLHILEK